MNDLPVIQTEFGCETCAQLPECGGLTGLDRVEGCFVACRNRGCQCDGAPKWTCPCRKSEYLHRMRTVGGAGTFIPPLIRPFPSALPLAIPAISHGSRRLAPLDYPLAAIPLRYAIACLVKDGPEETRRHFGLAPQTKMLLVSIAQDRFLERYWADRREFGWVERISNLGIIGATTPNFSFFSDAPRPHIVYNRRRILLTAGELSAAGVPVIPHLNAQTETDWRYWEALLGQQQGIVYVAKEFQTGLQHAEEGRSAIVRLDRLQQSLGRQLHPLIVGGTQHVEFVARYFERASFVMATPFMKTMHRQAALPAYRLRWKPAPTEPGDALDQLLICNIETTEKNISDRWQMARGEYGGDLASVSPPYVRHRRYLASEQQMSLPI